MLICNCFEHLGRATDGSCQFRKVEIRPCKIAPREPCECKCPPYSVMAIGLDEPQQISLKALGWLWQRVHCQSFVMHASSPVCSRLCGTVWENPTPNEQI